MCDNADRLGSFMLVRWFGLENFASAQADRVVETLVVDRCKRFMLVIVLGIFVRGNLVSSLFPSCLPLDYPLCPSQRCQTASCFVIKKRSMSVTIFQDREIVFDCNTYFYELQVSIDESG